MYKIMEHQASPASEAPTRADKLEGLVRRYAKRRGDFARYLGLKTAYLRAVRAELP